MKRVLFLITVMLTAVFVFFPSDVRAIITNYGDVNGRTTFMDTSTNLVWLDLNNFSNMNFNQLVAGATAAGFTVADLSAVQTLLSSLPDPQTNWVEYRGILGAGPVPRMWAVYQPSTPGWIGEFWANSDDSVWHHNSYLGPNEGTFLDMNIWAYRTAPVPIPGAVWLFGSGLVGLVGIGRKRFKK